MGALPGNGIGLGVEIPLPPKLEPGMPPDDTVPPDKSLMKLSVKDEIDFQQLERRTANLLSIAKTLEAAITRYLSEVEAERERARAVGQPRGGEGRAWTDRVVIAKAGRDA